MNQASKHTSRVWHPLLVAPGDAPPDWCHPLTGLTESACHNGWTPRKARRPPNTVRPSAAASLPEVGIMECRLPMPQLTSPQRTQEDLIAHSEELIAHRSSLLHRDSAAQLTSLHQPPPRVSQPQYRHPEPPVPPHPSVRRHNRRSFSAPAGHEFDPAAAVSDTGRSARASLLGTTTCLYTTLKPIRQRHSGSQTVREATAVPWPAGVVKFSRREIEQKQKGGSANSANAATRFPQTFLLEPSSPVHVQSPRRFTGGGQIPPAPMGPNAPKSRAASLMVSWKSVAKTRPVEVPRRHMTRPVEVPRSRMSSRIAPLRLTSHARTSVEAKLAAFRFNSRPSQIDHRFHAQDITAEVEQTKDAASEPESLSRSVSSSSLDAWASVFDQELTFGFDVQTVTVNELCDSIDMLEQRNSSSASARSAASSVCEGWGDENDREEDIDSK